VSFKDLESRISRDGYFSKFKDKGMDYLQFAWAVLIVPFGVIWKALNSVQATVGDHEAKLAVMEKQCETLTGLAQESKSDRASLFKAVSVVRTEGTQQHSELRKELSRQHETLRKEQREDTIRITESIERLAG